MQKENIDRATGETFLPPFAGHTSCTGSALWQRISRDVSQLLRNSTITVVASLVADCHYGVGTDHTNISLLRKKKFKGEEKEKKKHVLRKNGQEINSIINCSAENGHAETNMLSKPPSKYMQP